MKGWLQHNKSLEVWYKDPNQDLKGNTSSLDHFFLMWLLFTLSTYTYFGGDAVILYSCMSLPASFAFLIKLMKSGRHVRERHTKTKSWFTLLECSLFHQDKGNNLSTPWAGLDHRAKEAEMCMCVRLRLLQQPSLAIFIPA